MSKSTKVKYYDPTGRAQNGYIIDDKTYKDPDGQTRVDLGSVVETADGNYTLTSSGGVRSDSVNILKNQVGIGMRDARKTAKRAIDSAYNAQVIALKGQKDKLKSYYNKNVQSQYINNKTSQKNMEQKLKNLGISGGLSESTLLSKTVSEEEMINKLKQELDDNMLDIDTQILKLRSDTDYNLAMADAKYDDMYLDFLQNNIKMEIEEKNSDRENNSKNYMFNIKYDRDLYEDERDYSRNIFEKDRDYDRNILETDRNYDRGIYESDREFDWEMYENNRNFDRNIYEDDRDYNRGIFEYDKTYNLNKLNKDRAYNLSNKKSSSSKSKPTANKTNDDAYQKELTSAKALASFGDFSGYAKLFGWNSKQLEEAQRQYYLKKIDD